MWEEKQTSELQSRPSWSLYPELLNRYALAQVADSSMATPALPCTVSGESANDREMVSRRKGREDTGKKHVMVQKVLISSQIITI